MTQKFFINLLCMIATTFISAQNSYIIDASIGTQSTAAFNKNESIGSISSSSTFKNNTTLNNTIEYSNTSFNSKTAWNSSIAQLNNLHKISYSVAFKQPLSTRLAVAATINPVAGFETNFKTSQILLLGGLAFDYIFTPKTKLTLGVQRNTYFGKTQIVPTIAFQQQLSNSIALDLGFPSTRFSYTNNPRTIFSFSTQIKGSRYTIDPQAQSNTTLSNATLQLSTLSSLLECERTIDTNWFVTFKGGYQNNIIFKIADNNTITNHNNTEGLIGTFGIKYKL